MGFLLFGAGSSCGGQASDLKASGYVSGAFTEGGQVLDGTDIAATCAVVEGKFASTSHYVLLDWDESQTTLLVNFKRIDVMVGSESTERQTFDRTYSGPGATSVPPPSHYGGEYVFKNVKLTLTSGAGWQENLPTGEVARRQLVAAGIPIVNPGPDNPEARALVTGPDGLVHSTPQPPPLDGGTVTLNGTVYCEPAGF